MTAREYPMIAAGKVQEVERLLSEGQFSQRQIARRTGVSRATVSAIADGTRPDYEAQRRLRDLRQAEDECQGPVERCKGCGGLTQMPCRVCRVRKFKAQQHEAKRVERQQIRQRELRRLLLLQRAIALGEMAPLRCPAA
jgi:transcriptional regulator with XRE-family HTH domain